MIFKKYFWNIVGYKQLYPHHFNFRGDRTPLSPSKSPPLVCLQYPFVLKLFERFWRSYSRCFASSAHNHYSQLPRWDGSELSEVWLHSRFIFTGIFLLWQNTKTLPYYVGHSAWNCLPQSLRLELLALAPPQFWRLLKTFVFTDIVPGRMCCWFGCCYTSTRLQNITLRLHCFVAYQWLMWHVAAYSKCLLPFLLNE